jgi:hypothetical protein
MKLIDNLKKFWKDYGSYFVDVWQYILLIIILGIALIVIL